MRSTIGGKFFIGFASVMLLTGTLVALLFLYSRRELTEIIGRNSMYVADQTISQTDKAINNNIDDLLRLVQEPLLREAVKDSNAAFEEMPDREAFIAEEDARWIAAPKDEEPEFIRSVTGNPLSKMLREQLIDFYLRRNGYNIFHEAFVTNAYGANVGQTGRTSDFYQADEEWWIQARDQGLWVGDFEYDESADAYVLVIAVRLTDEEGKFIGAMKALMGVAELIRESELSTSDIGQSNIRVVDREGRMIYSNRTFRFLEDVSSMPYFRKAQDAHGYFQSYDGSRLKLFSYSRSRGYANYTGNGWVLFVEHDLDSIFLPIATLENYVLLGSLAALILGVLAAYLISRSITRGAAELGRVSQEFSRGNFAARAKVRSKDELGHLGAVFNEMAGRLEESRGALEDQNKRLETEVAARTRELREKLDELGKANQLMVGRELKMIELKKEVDRLKKAPN